MKFAVIVFPGSNCDYDAFYVVKNILDLGVEFVWHKNSDLSDFDCIIIPGGFSYGDYLRAGAIARFSHIMQSVKDEGGKPYGIPAGASVHKYGGLGYVGFAQEVKEQEKELGFKFDYIIVCVVTGSTMGGMVVGFAEDNRANTVIGIDASGTPKKNMGASKKNS